jgi:ubiquinone/menaquinone biosynthesis C-methylase UbiE
MDRERNTVAYAMKADWNARARVNAKWYINTVQRVQSDAEFDAGGRREVEALVLADLSFLTRDRDPRSLRFLEIGCGLGRMTRALAAIFGEVHATDVSGEMIRRAGERLRDLSNVCLYETDGLGCRALPDQSMDIVFSAYVFQHVPDALAIRSNIVDGFRVLKPGGIMKFQTMDFSNEEYARMPKDTWAGAAFTASQLRQTAREIGADLIQISGKGTQYCWTTLSRRDVTPETLSRSNAVPEILEAGRWNDRSVSSVAVSGEDARISILASRGSLQGFDTSAVAVLLQGQRIEPDYVGPENRRWTTAGEADTVEIIASVPGTIIPGPAEIVLRAAGRHSSPSVLTMTPAPRPRLLIAAVQNGFDGGLDIEVSGPKSLVCLLVDGFESAPAITELRVSIGGDDLNAAGLERIQGKGGYIASIKLPALMRPGRYDLQVRHGDQESLVHQLDIVGRRVTTLADLTPELDDAAAIRAQGLSHGHPLFSAAYYLEQNPDVARAGMDPLAHYVRSGATEGRNPHPMFSVVWYLARCRNVIPPGMTPVTHYNTVGVHMDMSPHPLFDALFYRQQVPDLDVTKTSPLAHYLTVGWRHQLDPHPLFSSAYFCDRCAAFLPDCIAPLEFYLSSPLARAIDPHRWFSATHYLASSPDVARSGMNPLLHYVLRGATEGRSPHPDFDVRRYRRDHAGSTMADVNPLMHFLAHASQNVRGPRLAPSSTSSAPAAQDRTLQGDIDR